MNMEEYVKSVVKTENAKEITMTLRQSRLDHAASGLATEAGEFVDQIKRHIHYGFALDVVNCKEELGDLMWYIGIAADELGYSLSDIMETNILKLKARYTDGKFTKDEAEARNINKERKILEDDYDECNYCSTSKVKVGVSTNPSSGKKSYWYFCSSCGNSAPQEHSLEKSLESWNEHNKSTD